MVSPASDPVAKAGTIIDQQQPPGIQVNTIRQTETVYQPVPTTDVAEEAYKEAMRREVKMNPQLAGVFQRVEATKANIVHGNQVAQRTASGQQS